MNSKHICRHCGNDTFIMMAHVTQDWIVNNRGEFCDCLKDCVDVLHAPNDNDVWECQDCGADDPMVLRENEHPVIIPKADFERFEKLLQQESVDYGKEGIVPYSCIWSWTAQIEDISDESHKIEVDVKVCSSGWNDDVWTEAVLFDNGSEVACSEVQDTLNTTWEFDLEGQTIIVVPVFVDNPCENLVQPAVYTFGIPRQEYLSCAELLERYPLDEDNETRCYKHPELYAEWTFDLNKNTKAQFFVLSNEAKNVYWVEVHLKACGSDVFGCMTGRTTAQDYGSLTGRTLNQTYTFSKAGKSYAVALKAANEETNR